MYRYTEGCGVIIHVDEDGGYVEAIPVDNRDQRYLALVLSGADVLPFLQDDDLSWQRVTPAQAKIALFRAGLLDAVEADIATQYRPVQLYWQFATEFYRFNPYIMAIGASLGLTEGQIDALFLAASLIK